MRKLQVVGQPEADLFRVRAGGAFTVEVTRDELGAFVAEAAGLLGWDFDVEFDEED